jgi:hypothetical protein
MTGNLAPQQDKRFFHQTTDIHAFCFAVSFPAESAQPIDYLARSMHVVSYARYRLTDLLQVGRANIEIPNAYVAIDSNGGKRLFQFMCDRC